LKLEFTWKLVIMQTLDRDEMAAEEL
jgi:hypothetical protein